MGTSTTVDGELTIPALSSALWAREEGVDPSLDPQQALLTALADRITEHTSPEDAITVTRQTSDELHVLLHGDWCSNSIDDLLNLLSILGVRGRVLFPDDQWGYELAADGVGTVDAAVLWPDDQVVMLTVDKPGKETHRAIYGDDRAAIRALHRLHVEWKGPARTPADLDAALATLAAEGATVTCQALPFNP